MDDFSEQDFRDEEGVKITDLDVTENVSISSSIIMRITGKVRISSYTRKMLISLALLSSFSMLLFQNSFSSTNNAVSSAQSSSIILDEIGKKDSCYAEDVKFIEVTVPSPGSADSVVRISWWTTDSSKVDLSSSKQIKTVSCTQP